MELSKQTGLSVRQQELSDSLFAPDYYEHYAKLAVKLTQSNVVPKAYQNKPNDAFICMALGYKLGFTVEQSLQSIGIINGKPVIYGDGMLALVMSSPQFEDIDERRILSDKGDVIGYECEVFRKNKKPKIRDFTLEDASRAGLLGKGVWAQYPQRMLQMRARAFALRDAFPDILLGISAAEEVMDYIETDYEVVVDKSSRTETLKNDIKSKSGIKDDPKNQTKNEQDFFDSENPFATEKNQEVRTEDCKTEADAEDINVESPETMSGSTDENIIYHEIHHLLSVLDFDSDKTDKLLHYYSVERIEDLTMQQAKHCKAQLAYRLQENDK